MHNFTDEGITMIPTNNFTIICKQLCDNVLFRLYNTCLYTMSIGKCTHPRKTQLFANNKAVTTCTGNTSSTRHYCQLHQSWGQTLKDSFPSLGSWTGLSTLESTTFIHINNSLDSLGCFDSQLTHTHTHGREYSNANNINFARLSVY